MSAPQPAPTHTPTARVPLWDNARWIAITLMVVGHAILKLIGESDPAYAMYLFIYAFHVPIFVAVSGYFARSGPPGTRQLQRLLTDIAFPYVIFETIWTCVRWLLGGRFSLDYSTASWTLWFLLALLVWRIILPYLVMLRYPLLISIVLSIGAGYIDHIDSTFTLSRTIGLLPFFVFGWKLRQWKLTERWLTLSTASIWKWRSGALALFASVYLVIAVNIEVLRALKVRRFLLYDEGYSLFGYSEFWAGGIRLGFMILAFALIVAFLLLVPRRATWFTPLGSHHVHLPASQLCAVSAARNGRARRAAAGLGAACRDRVECADLHRAVASVRQKGLSPARRTARPLAVPAGGCHADRHYRAATQG